MSFSSSKVRGIPPLVCVASVFQPEVLIKAFEYIFIDVLGCNNNACQAKGILIRYLGLEEFNVLTSINSLLRKCDSCSQGPFSDI